MTQFPIPISDVVSYVVSTQIPTWFPTWFLTSFIMQFPKCDLSKLIIRHNIGPISAANSRLLLLGQYCCLHRSSAGPRTTAAFVDCLNLPTFNRNLAQNRRYTKPIITFTMTSSSESRTANVRPMSAHYWAMCHFYQGKPFWKLENQRSAQHWPVAVPKTSVGGQSLGQNWQPSVNRSYHSSNGTILATDLWQYFRRCWASVESYLTSHLGSYVVSYVRIFNRVWNSMSGFLLF